MKLLYSLYLTLFFLSTFALGFGKDMKNEYPPFPEYEVVKVIRIVDGDTLEILSPSCGVQKIRMVGVDTPESTTRKEPFGKDARQFTEKKIRESNYEVTLEGDGLMYDRFGRRIAVVWLTGGSESDSLNLLLLREGLAMTRLDFPFSEENKTMFVDTERWACRMNKGIWSSYEGKLEKILKTEEKLR